MYMKFNFLCEINWFSTIKDENSNIELKFNVHFNTFVRKFK